jgi:hypothetical protein
MAFHRQAVEEARKHVLELVRDGTRFVVCPATGRMLRLAEDDDDTDGSGAEDAEDQKTLEEQRSRQQASTNAVCLYAPSEEKWLIMYGDTVQQFVEVTDQMQARSQAKKRRSRFPVCTGSGATGMVPSYVLPLT